MLLVSASFRVNVAFAAEDSREPETPLQASKPEVALRPWKSIVLHHSATASGSVESIDAAHRRRVDKNGKPWRGVGYHFVIGNGHGMADGEVAPTFRWLQQLDGAHAGDSKGNASGIGVCLVGDFETNDPTPRQLRAARELLASLATQCGLTTADVVPHGQVRATRCPGRRLDVQSLMRDMPASPAKTSSKSATILQKS